MMMGHRAVGELT